MLPEPDSEARPRILVVDDNETNRLILTEILADGFELYVASSGEECLGIAVEVEPDLVLLDIMMPGIDGYETCRRLRQIPELRYTKVIMVSAKAMLSERLRGYEAGADDYVTKPFDDAEMLSKIRVFLRLKSTEETNETISALNRELEELNERLASEVSRRRRAEAQLRHDALHDVLTDLPNRALLLDRAQRCLVRTREDTSFGFSILCLDVDDFKVVNDSLGHRVGDAVLVEISRRILSAVRTGDVAVRNSDTTTARMGGDEFVVLLEGTHRSSDAELVAQRIRERVSCPILVDGLTIKPQVSIGIAVSGPDYENEVEIIRDADTALYHAKSQGKNRIALFDERMHDRIVTRMRLENEISHAIGADQLFLEYQPIVWLATEEVCGLEALVRWHHPDRGVVYPGDFIPLAEESGLIVPLGRWVLRQAARQVAVWRRRFTTCSGISVSVNVSAREFAVPGFMDYYRRTLDEAGISLDDLALELTETVLMRNTAPEKQNLRDLACSDVALHMDDFGTGYSSLSYLSRLPITSLKLDRIFVAEMTTDPAGASTIKAVVEMAHSRGLKVVAEGAETAEQVATLKALGCDMAQGYYFARPMVPELLERMLSVTGRVHPHTA